VTLISAGAVVRPPIMAAAGPPWLPPPCPPSEAQEHAASGTWYRLDGVQDTAGTLTGQVLSVGVIGGPSRTMALAPEAFASGSHQGLVLVGEDDGTRSRLSLVDPAHDCARVVGETDDVVRSALVSLDGTAVWEHRVARAAREDLGIWRRPLDGRPATRQLRGAPADARYGRTFATELRWTPDGALAATTCGESACRTRIMDEAGGPVTTVGPTGPVLGAGGDGTVVAYRVCGGFPCAIERHGAGPAPEQLVAAAGRAAVAGNRLVFEPVEGGLRAMDLDGTGTSVIAAATDLIPLGDGSRATAGGERRDGSVLLAPHGRLDGATLMVLDRGDRTPHAVGGAVR
jgi:hypothetical protein